MKILHLGNVAMNAYSNAKFLRRKGIEADVLVLDYTYIMSQPEWEDAYFEEEIKDEWHPDWSKVNLHGFKRPKWFKEYLTGAPQSVPESKSIKGRWWTIKNTILFGFYLREGLRIRGFIERERQKYLKMERLSAFKKNGIAEKMKHIFSGIKVIGRFQTKYSHIRFLKSIINKYDIIQAYGNEVITAVLAASEKPLVSFEHGTMRDILLADSSTNRLLILAYNKSKKCIITNPDGKITADKIGLNNYVFIPHPVDTEKFSPHETKFRKKIMDETGAELIFFAPARNDWWIKNNDKIIEAFSDYLKNAEKKTVLIFCEWGRDIEKSKNYINKLGIGKYVIWTPPLSKTILAEHYNASDVVLDQFLLGVFGGIPPEAMACAKPVITKFDWEVNKWAWPEKPPVVPAASSQEIFESMKLLAQNENLRKELGKRGRIWMEKYHSWELVAEKQIKIYKEILNNG